MAEPLRYDMVLPEGEPLRYDMGPEFTWDGDVPATNSPDQHQNQTMTQDLLNLNLTDADWTAIDAALATLETKLGAKLIDLTPDQRQKLTKMGDGSEAFCREALITARQNTAKLSGESVADLTAAEADLGGFDKLRPRLARLQSLAEKADDSSLALGSDVMVFSLFLYGVLKAVGLGAGLDTVRAQLRARFPGRAKKKTPPKA